MTNTRTSHELLHDERRRVLQAWCDLHGIDHTLVPIDAKIERDPETGDWLVEAHKRKANGFVLSDANGPVKQILRVPFRAELDWPTEVPDEA